MIIYSYSLFNLSGMTAYRVLRNGRSNNPGETVRIPRKNGRKTQFHVAIDGVCGHHHPVNRLLTGLYKYSHL